MRSVGVTLENVSIQHDTKSADKHPHTHESLYLFSSSFYKVCLFQSVHLHLNIVLIAGQQVFFDRLDCSLKKDL